MRRVDSNYAIVEVEGLTTITDQREFVVRHATGLTLPTPNNDPYEMALSDTGGSPDVVGIVDEHTPLSCECCGSFLDRHLVEHNGLWMYTAFGCDNHPEKAAYLDIFPKVGYDTGWDWTNAFMGLSLPRLVEGVEITPDTTEDDRAQVYRDYAGDNRYRLTPEGISKVSGLRFGWLDGIRHLSFRPR